MTHRISPKLSNRQRDFITGTVLGGSSIVKPSKGKNCYLSMRSKDFEWLRFKATELMSLASDTPITREKTNRWHSICYPVFNEFRELFYHNNRRCLTSERLDSLRIHDRAWAIWYGDCGILLKNRVILNTHIWGESGTKVIHEYFDSMDYQPEIIRQRSNFRIKLGEEGSLRFWKLVAPTLDPFFSLQKSRTNTEPR
ncbi:MAG: hypothetical protein ACXADB_04210 [Candidatus Hermodarchaeia archaeon]